MSKREITSALACLFGSVGVASGLYVLGFAIVMALV